MPVTLTNTTEMPYGGYAYREPAINFDVGVGSALAMQGLTAVAQALQQARVNNPGAGLDPDYQACVEAIKAFTCARLASKPKLFAHFCGELATAAAVVYEPVVQPLDASRPVTRQRRTGCASCGRRR